MDHGSRYAEKRQRIIELRVQRIYREAAKELGKQFDAFLEAHRKKGAEMWEKLKNGEISLADYSSWMRAQVLTGKRWQQKIDTATDTLASANEKALTIVRGEQLNVFSENANYEAYQIEKDAEGAVSFDIYDVSTVDRLVRDHPELLPPRILNKKKDRAWNQGVMARTVTQAIIQGESIPDLAKRLSRDTANTNMKAMVRYARTAMTGAQNGGRMEMLHRAQGMGIQVKKVWMATLDSRTRDSHQHLDGKKVGVDEKFPNGLMFPGDPNGSAGEVYNCRCTLVYDYEGFPHDQEKDQRLQYDERDETVTVRKKDRNGREYEKQVTIHHRDSSLIRNMTYDEWKKTKYKRYMEEDARESKNNPMLEQLTFNAKKNILTGERVIRGIGAKSRSYPELKNPFTGERIEVVPGTEPVYPPDHTIAGWKCRTGKKIGDIKRLVRDYKVDAKHWQKEKARYQVLDEHGKTREVEAHWYQHPDVGKVEYKVKVKGGCMYADEWEDDWYD